MSRRRFGALGIGAAASATLLSCGGSTPTTTGSTVRIGYVAPRTGYDTHLTAADDFMLAQIRRAVENGLLIDNRVHPVEIQEADSTSEAGAAAEVATQLVEEREVTFLIGAGGAETTVEVAEVAETTGTPCVTGYGPWQPWLLGRGGDPDVGFIWSFHLGWGFEDLRRINDVVFSAVSPNETVGLMWLDSPDGSAARDDDTGLVSAFEVDGYQVVDAGPLTRLPETFEPHLRSFVDSSVHLVSGLLGSPDVLDLRGESDLMGFEPSAMTLAFGGAAPSVIAALGPLGDGITCEVTWSDRHPFSSSLNGMTAAELGSGYDVLGGPPPALGTVHALFEVAIDAIVRSGDPTRKRRIVAALEDTDLDTMVGPVSFAASAMRNVAKIPVVAGQWRVTDDGSPVLDLVESNDALGIRANAPIRRLV